ncbi:MAG: AtpZ/AtpI family protein [Bacteroidota bacterium]
MPSANKPTSERSDDSSPKKSTNAYLKYSGMAFQMGAVILVGVLIGRQLDKYFETEQPLWTAGCALFFTLAAIYYVVKDEL